MTPATQVPSLLVSTDMDGTLLDHHDYSWNAAIPAMDQLRQRHIPIIFNTSKTFDEVRALRHAMGIDTPFIVENGSALYIPRSGYELLDLANASEQKVCAQGGYWQVLFGQTREDILDCIHRLRVRNNLPFEGFADWSAAAIAQRTGLDEAAAQLAANKHFSEPIVWHGDQQQLGLFAEALDEHELRLLKGGRFYHVQGRVDKGTPLRWLQHRYAETGGFKPALVCLGDSENDVAMLNVADYPVCVKSPVAGYPFVRSGRPVLYTDEYGPAGWNEAIGTIIAQHIK